VLFVPRLGITRSVWLLGALVTVALAAAAFGPGRRRLRS
jgi:hypothetical protein